MSQTVMPFYHKYLPKEAHPGVLLVLSGSIALILANSPLSEIYQLLLRTPLEIRIGAFDIAKPFNYWINDGLMAIFFFLIGLEIKREICIGQLSSKDQIFLPGIAAVFGIILPALIYLFFTRSNPIATTGWAIPSATDIAFALSIFTIFGTRLPLSLKLFLLSVAIFDDLGAILIIAVFYSSDLSWLSLGVASIAFFGLFLLNQFQVSRQAAYILLSTIAWASVLKSGVHATLAGFCCAWFIPLKTQPKHNHSMLMDLEDALHPWVFFGILPLFAFANAGVSFEGLSLKHFLEPLPLGIIFGLFFGKQIGIFGISFLTIKLKLAKMPKGARWIDLYAISILCGIGFTMSLFIGTLAFEHQPAILMQETKLGVLFGSFCSALFGVSIIQFFKKINRSTL